MAVRVTCPCGQKLSVPDEAIGRPVKCPKCQAVFVVRAGQATEKSASPPAEVEGRPGRKSSAPATAPAHDSVFDELGLAAKPEGIECPECHAHLPVNAVLCVQCGYSFQLGRKLPTLGLESTAVRQTEGKPKTEVEKMLDFAERELANEPLRQDLGYGSAASAWLIFAAMLLVAAAVIAGGVMFFNYMEGNAGKEDGKKKSGAVPWVHVQTRDVV